MKDLKSARLTDLLKQKSSDSMSESEIDHARDNLIGFFQTLLEVARGNPELINQDTQMILSRKDYKH